MAVLIFWGEHGLAIPWIPASRALERANNNDDKISGRSSDLVLGPSRVRCGSTGSGKARLNLVFVLDGLRPDSINPDDTPNLHKLRLEGVNFLNGHSVFPTVTRVNATAIACHFAGPNEQRRPCSDAPSP